MFEIPISLVLEICWNCPNHVHSLACFYDRTEMFALCVALGDVEMLNSALRSLLRGEKKHFMQV